MVERWQHTSRLLRRRLASGMPYEDGVLPLGQLEFRPLQAAKARKNQLPGPRKHNKDNALSLLVKGASHLNFDSTSRAWWYFGKRTCWAYASGPSWITSFT